MCSAFCFHDTATTEIYTLSLHDALPISVLAARAGVPGSGTVEPAAGVGRRGPRLHRTALRDDRRLRRPGDRARDRKSTRLNSSHSQISYAVFCLKKKKTNTKSMYNVSHI